MMAVQLSQRHFDLIKTPEEFSPLQSARFDAHLIGRMSAYLDEETLQYCRARAIEDATQQKELGI